MHSRLSNIGLEYDPQKLPIKRLIQKHFSRSPWAKEVLDKLATVPTWYRGLSACQIDAVNNLNDSLRDDIEQQTTFRLKRLLDCLGVHPIPTQKDIQLLIDMSRGNDLAFLWFLMELCYKTKEHGHSYDVNEQIIMSAIFWLDLNPTLRELDRVLPLPQESAAERARLEKKAKHEELNDKLKHEQNKKQQMNKRKSLSPLAPYFEKPVLPKDWRKSQSMTADYPARPALLRPVPKETINSTFWSRWFGENYLTESQRVVNSVIYAEVNNIFESIQSLSIPSKKVKSMCAYHQRINEMERSLKVELEEIKRENYKEMLMGRNRADERRRKRVLKELDRMTACFQAQFQALAEKARISSTRKHLITGSKPNIFSMPNIPGELSLPDDEHCQKPHIKLKKPSKKTICSEKTKTKEKAEKINVKLLKGINPIESNCPHYVPEKMKCANCDFYDPKKGLPEQGKENPRPSSVMQFLRLCGELETDKENNVSPPQLPSDSNSLTFFKLGSHDSSKFKFNYRRLFNESDWSHMDNEELRLKSAFINALNDDCQYLNAVLNFEEDGSVDTMVDRAAKYIFQKDAEIFHSEYERLVRRKAKKKCLPHRLDFGKKFYNPSDIKLMKHMLRVGLDKVGENRRYVLPTLPNVESVPYLVEWIGYRYGQRYTKKILNKSVADATMFMENLATLMKRRLVKELPSFIDYNIKDQDLPVLKRWAGILKSHYKNLFVESVMEIGRIFYYAMRPQLCSHLTSESTFFAYMPAKFHDTSFSATKSDQTRKQKMKRKFRRRIPI